MKHRFLLWALLVIASTPLLSHADGYNGYSWQGWRLSTSEGFNLESNGGNDSNLRNNRVAFPMTQLLDGDPNTTWVWDDAVWKKRNKATGGDSDYYKVRSLEVSSEKNVVADELWVMNGYNKSQDLFRRNDRVIEIRIHLDNKTLKKVALSDKMGWHKISIPRRTFKNLKIDLTKIRKGSGEDNDICLSELALYSKGKKVDFKMPRAAIYQLSYCCGGTAWLINRGGRVLIEAPVGEGGAVVWSPNGNRVAGLDYTGRGQKIWIADANAPRIIRRHQFKLKDYRYGFDLSWKGNQAL